MEVGVLRLIDLVEGEGKENRSIRFFVKGFGGSLRLVDLGFSWIRLGSDVIGFYSIYINIGGFNYVGWIDVSWLYEVLCLFQLRRLV